MSDALALTVNGQSLRLDVAPDTPLLYVLRNDLQLNGPKFGCGLGECGACTVLMDGVATRSCITPVEAAVGRRVVTLEGLGDAAIPIRCNRPSSTNRPPNAATASTAW